jgi:cbb3-type cytochrome oxidase maturation protein
MEILIFLVPLASVVVAIAVWAFIWALRRGQFDDLDSPAWRIVFDDQERQRKADTETDTHEDSSK